MKKLIAIVLAMSICLLCGCAPANVEPSTTAAPLDYTMNENGIPIMSEAKKAALNPVVMEHYDFPKEPGWGDGTKRVSLRYYGTFEGYDVIFDKGQLTVVSSEEIAGYVFENGSSFTLQAHKDGEFVFLKDLYEDGKITADAIAKIFDIHQRYEALPWG